MSYNAAQQAYSRPDAPVRTPRGIEYELLARATKRLTLGQARREKDFPGFVAALNDNLLLWSTLAADVADPNNALPKKLRGQLFYLYRFTAEHSRNVLEGNAGVQVLIDINTAVMRGLRGATGGVE